MLPDTLWQVELLKECKSRRSLITKLLLPIILVGPLAIAPVSPAMRSGGVALALIFIGVFGSSIGIVGLRDSKMLERLAALPISHAAIIFDYILARSLFLGIQLIIPLSLILLVGQSMPISALWILLCFISSLVTASSLGVLVALVARSSGEVHLYAFLTVIAVVGLSGLFPGMDEMSVAEPISPFWQLSNVLLFSWGVTELYMPTLALVMSTAILLATYYMSSRLFRLG